MFGYIYLVRNKVNGMQYIGQKHSEVFLPDYFGSGVYLKRALSKYGVENFEHVKVLEWCETKEDLDQAERYWIDKYNAVESSEFYNLAKGGVGTTAGSKRSDTFKQAIALKTSQRIWTDESRQKVSDSISGRVWVNNGEIEKQIVPEEAQNLVSTQNFKYGRLSFSESTRQNMSSARKGKCYESDESLARRSEKMKGEGNPFSGKTHSDEQKLKWSITRREMVWVNKDGKNTTIHISKLQEYLDNGWTRGMIRKSKSSSTTIESVVEEKDLDE